MDLTVLAPLELQLQSACGGAGGGDADREAEEGGEREVEAVGRA